MRVCSYCHLHIGEAAHEPCDAPAIELVAEVAPPGLSDAFGHIEPFARGAVGTSYLATHRASQRRGVLKLIDPTVAGSGSELMRLKRELRKQTTFEHPGLVSIYDGGEHGKLLWLFREYVEGESLSLWLKRDGALSQGDTLAIVIQVAAALDELHRQGLLHRDVKPRHILLSPNGDAPPRVRLIDASLAPRHASGGVFDMVGTPAYMSPEQAANKLVSFRSDLYSLGCVMYEMLAGEQPYSGELDALVAAHREQPLPELSEDLPDRIQQLLRDLTAKEPRRRPFSAQQVRRALEPLVPEDTPLGNASRRVPQAERSPAFKGASVPPPRARSASTAPKSARSVPPPVPFDVSPKTERLDTRTLAKMAVDDVEKAALEGRSITQELHTRDLSELAIRERLAAGVDADRPPTEELSISELADLAYDEQPRGTSEAGSTDELATRDLSEMAVDALEGTVPARSARPAQAMGHADRQPSPASDEPPTRALTVDEEQPTIQLSTSAPPAIGSQAPPRSGAPAQPASWAPGSMAPAPRTPVPGSRAAVNFDVESLFEDEDRPPSGEPDEGAAAPDGSATSSAPAPPVDDVVASDGPPRSRMPWKSMALGVLALAGVLWMVSGDDDPKTAAGASTGEQVQEADQESDQASDPPTAVAAQLAGDQEASGPARDNEASGPAQESAAAVAGSEEEVEASEGPEDEQPEDEQSDDEQARGEASAGARAAGEGEGEAAPADSPPAASRSAGAETARKASPARKSGAAAAKSPARASSSPSPKRAKGPSAADYKDQARTHYRAKRYARAASAYRAATRAAPKDAGAFAGLGASLLASGKAAQAVSAYQKAVRLKPKVSGFHAALGRAYLRNGDRRRSVAAYKRALKLNPKNGAARAALKKLGVR